MINPWLQDIMYILCFAEWWILSNNRSIIHLFIIGIFKSQSNLENISHRSLQIQKLYNQIIVACIEFYCSVP